MSTDSLNQIEELIVQDKRTEASAQLTNLVSQSADPEILSQIGNMFYLIGDYDKALACVSRALSANPSAKNNFTLGLILLKLNKPQDALVQFREACEKEPNNAIGHFQWGIALSQMGSYKGSIGQFNQAIKLNANLIGAYLKAGEISKQLGLYPEAITYLTKALELNPKLPFTLNMLGTIYAIQGQYEKAISEYEKAAAISKDIPNVHRNWATALLNLGKIEEATAHYQIALEENPRDLSAHERALVYNDWGVNLAKLGRLDEAFEKLVHSADIDPKHATSLLNLAFIEFNENEIDKAQAAFEQVATLLPDSFEAHFHLGLCHFLKGNFEDALNLLLRSETLAEEFDELYLALAHVYIQMEEVEKSKEVCLKGIGKNPTNFLLYDAHGLALSEEGQHQQAIEKYQQALKINPSYALAHLHISRSFEALGRIKESEDEYKIALTIEPRCLELEKDLLIELPRGLRNNLALDKALKLLEIAPQDLDVQITLAKALRAQNMLDECKELLRHIMAIDPKNAQAHELLASTYLGEGKLQEADAAFSKASELGARDVSLFYLWAKTLSMLGLHDLALEKYEIASEIDPFDSDVYEAWGSTLKMLGRYQEATEVFKKASNYI